MGADTLISWTNTTWNPLAGCTKVSPGCKNCYAERMANRLEGMAIGKIAEGRNPGRLANYTDVTDLHGRWNGHIHLDWDAINEPAKWRKPRMVFVNSMSDLFHESVPVEFIRRVFEVMKVNPQHTFQVLTKRPERIAARLPDDWGDAGFDNVWIGTSVEDQHRADERCEALVHAVPLGRSFVSAEPLLGPVKLRTWLWHVHWVIVGGESGPEFRPMDPKWVDRIKADCDCCGTAFFYKQDAARKQGTIADPNRWPQELPRALREPPKGER